MRAHPNEEAESRIEATLLENWVQRLVERVGTPPDIASDVAEVLLAADLRGIASHGTARLPIYVSLIQAQAFDPRARPERVGGAPALALFDGHNGWGPHAGRLLMDDAIERARSTGMAASSIRHANHFGVAGWYSMRASAAGLIGLTMTNTSSLVAPTRSRRPMLGTNPIAVAVPAGRLGPVVLDMATSTVPWGRLEVAARRREALPAGVAIDRDGLPTTSPDDALLGALMPLGGSEDTAGYKGYGLAMIVDILTGVLAGANFGTHVIGFSTTEGPSNLGQLFLAIDPGAIGDPSAFGERVETMVEELRAAPLAPGAPGPVLVPGDPEIAATRRNREAGIPMDQAHLRSLIRLGEELDVPFPRPS